MSWDEAMISNVVDIGKSSQVGCSRPTIHFVFASQYVFTDAIACG